jgi:hypothetical protein
MIIPHALRAGTFVLDYVFSDETRGSQWGVLTNLQ